MVKKSWSSYPHPQLLQADIYRPGGVVASTLASHAEDQGSILVGIAGQSTDHGVNGRGAYQCFESNTSA